eukprot:1141881-Rhodomonas_salina.1
MFGGRVSGNLLDTLLAPFDRWVYAQGILYLRWVDDCAFCVPPRPEYRHDTEHCGGVDGCWMCKDTYRRVCELQRKVMAFLEELGFTFNEKLQPPAQR